MSVKVEKIDNKNEVKLEFTIEAKVFEAAMKNIFVKIGTSIKNFCIKFVF